MCIYFTCRSVSHWFDSDVSDFIACSPHLHNSDADLVFADMLAGPIREMEQPLSAALELNVLKGDPQPGADEGALDALVLRGVRDVEGDRRETGGR